MTRILLALSVFLVASIAAGNAYAASCGVPPVLEVDKTYAIAIGAEEPSIGKVVKIDEQSCWIQVEIEGEGDFWVNLSQVSILYKSE